MTTHTGFYLRPTLAEQVEGWCGVGFKAREAVRELIQLRMRQTSAKGGGHRAKRRMARLKIKRAITLAQSTDLLLEMLKESK